VTHRRDLLKMTNATQSLSLARFKRRESIATQRIHRAATNGKDADRCESNSSGVDSLPPLAFQAQCLDKRARAVRIELR
jgi:hypothetical protein